MTFQELLNTELDLRSIGALVARGFRWWIDELTALLPKSWQARFSSRPRVLAERVSAGHWRFWRDGRPLDAGSAARDARSGVGLLLAPEAVLVREVDIPRMSDADVRRMLALDIDRLSPLSPDLIHFDMEIDDGVSADGRRSVLLGIVSRAAAARLIQEARDDRLSPASLGVRCGGGDVGQRFDFLPAALEGADQTRQARVGGLLRAAVAGLLVLNLAVLVGRDMAETSRLRGLVDAQGPAVDAAMRLRRRVEDEEARRRELVLSGLRSEPLRMLNALTESTPRGAWVQHLEWNGRALRVVGFKTPELDMSAAIRGSGAFSNPRPLTSGGTSGPLGGQPFDITADARSDR